MRRPTLLAAFLALPFHPAVEGLDAELDISWTRASASFDGVEDPDRRLQPPPAAPARGDPERLPGRRPAPDRRTWAVGNLGLLGLALFAWFALVKWPAIGYAGGALIVLGFFVMSAL